MRGHEDQVAAVLLGRPDDRLEGMIALRVIAVRLDAGFARALGQPAEDFLRLLARDAIVLVDAPRPIRLERMVATRGVEETEAMNMIASQMPAELKRARADYVIE